VYVVLRLLGVDRGKAPYTLSNGLESACILLGVIFFLSLMKRYFWEYYFGERRGVEIPKFLREVFSVVIFCIALVAVVVNVYGGHVSGVVLSSTVVVGIIGWAMQDLLGNVISGLALQIGKPFKSGDWLIIETRHAEVIEVNWRSTRLRTNDDHYIDVPNSSIVRSTVVNLSYPTDLHAMRMRVNVAYGVPPNKVREVLYQAALSAKGVLASPPPKIHLLDFADSAITYEVQFWMENHAAYNDINDSLHTRVWYALNRHGIEMPFPMRTVQIERKSKPAVYSLPEETRMLVRDKPFFKSLSNEEVQKIIEAATVGLFGRDEKIVEQGAEGSSMFILVSGEAAVYVAHGQDGDATRVAVLKAGDYFGEMSLLTGETRSATVTALTDCEVLEVAKAKMGVILQNNPQLLGNLSEMLAQRRLDNEGLLATTVEHHAMAGKKREYTQGFLQKLAGFFEL
jgi:small-conductance mechanosensitive channel/CRP-like cAMP-binding protein